MKTIAELLNSLAAKAGIDISTEDMKKLSLATASIEVPETVYQTLDTGLLTIDAAKNNQTLKAHFFAQSLNGIDNTLRESLAELTGGTIEEVETLLTSKQTGKAVNAALKKIAELEATKAGSTKGEKTELTQQINDLKGQLAAIAATHQTALTEKDTQHEGAITNLLIRNKLAGYNYASPVSADANLEIALTMLNKELNENGIVIKNDNGRVLLKAKDGSDYYDATHKAVAFDEFVDKTLSKHSLLKASDKNTGGGMPPSPAPSRMQPAGGNDSGASQHTGSALDRFRAAAAQEVQV